MLSRIRLGTGLILFFFVVTHFLNHMLGLWSGEVLEAGCKVFLVFWRQPFLQWLLYSSAAVHVGLSLWPLLLRRSLRMPRLELLRLLLALAILPLILWHVVSTRILDSQFDLRMDYGWIFILSLFLSPARGFQQFVVALVVWLHGCLGLHLWLRFRPGYQRLRPILFSVALLFPTFALMGFWMAGNQMVMQELVEYSRESATSELRPYLDFIDTWEIRGLMMYGALIAAVLVARWAGRWWEVRAGVFTVTYSDGRQVRMPVGVTILDASRRAGVSHLSLCGGHGRCTTCRVRIGRGQEHLPLPSKAEKALLDRLGLPTNVRLACQTRPDADVEVTQLLSPALSPFQHAQGPSLPPREKEIVILFADLRDFTALAEKKMPFDVVFLLNRYFAGMGKIIEEAGGRVDKFIGDGVMALFGLDTVPAVASRQACQAAAGMARELTEISRSLREELTAPLRMGIGIHAGSAVIGRMGFKEAAALTAIGDPINIASRLEQAAKELGVEAVISSQVAELSGFDFSRCRSTEMSIRGHRHPLDVRLVSDLSSLGASGNV